MKKLLCTRNNLFIASIFLLLIFTSCGKNNSLKLNVPAENLASDLENEIPTIMDNAMIPGMSTAVIRDGTILWSKGFGVKNIETKEPVNKQTVFEAASLSNRNI